MRMIFTRVTEKRSFGLHCTVNHMMRQGTTIDVSLLADKRPDAIPYVGHGDAYDPREEDRTEAADEEFPEKEVSCDDRILDSVYGPKEEGEAQDTEDRSYQGLVVECRDSGGSEEEDAVEDKRDPQGEVEYR